MLFAILSIVSANAQAKKWWANAIAFKFVNETTHTWGNWSDWEPTRILIVVNSTDQRITVYSSEVQLYDIVSVLEERHVDEDGDIVTLFAAVDQDGVVCHILWTETHNKYMRMYIYYQNIKWVYNIPVNTPTTKYL